MHLPESQRTSPASRSPQAILQGLGLLAVLWSGICPLATAQERKPPPLRIGGVNPAGVRLSATDTFGAWEFDVTNLTDQDRQARVFTFFAGRPDIQYGRDVWVPPRSTLSSWMLVGPAEAQAKGPSNSREIQVLLYDRTDGKDQLVLPPTEERIRSRLVLYHKREPFTAVMVDEPASEPPIFGELPQPLTPAEEAVLLTRGFRYARKLSIYLATISQNPLPPTAEAFQSVDHVVLASGRIARDPAGMQALRQWLQRGGKVWVMLDIVEPEVVADLIGDALDFQIVDRVKLTHFSIQTISEERIAPDPLVQEHERPVQFVRVLLPPGEKVRHTIDGWPVWFERQVGRGKVVFTNLGPRGWFRKRISQDGPSPFQEFPQFPIPNAPLEVVSEVLYPPPEEDPFKLDSFQSLLTAEIGYSVVSQGTVILVFGSFLIAAAGLGLAMRRSRRPELLAWLVPAGALAVTGVFFTLGESSRRAASATVAFAQVVDPVPGTEEASIHGLLSVYRPDSGPAAIGAPRGGFFQLDMAGIEGKTRRFTMMDMDSWHWENLDLPAGIRMARFQYDLATSAAIRVKARFGPQGLEGKVESAPFREVGDIILTSPTGRNLAIRLANDGTFRATGDDALAANQFLASTVLTDEQQRRQELYREFLKPRRTSRTREGHWLLAWARPADMHFDLAPDARSAGNALLMMPLEMERPAAGTQVVLPGPLVPCYRIVDNLPTRVPREAGRPANMHLRFQIPASVMPFTVEAATLFAKISAPARKVTISGIGSDRKAKELYRADGPIDPIRIDIADPQLLRLDKEGGLHLGLNMSGLQGAAATASREENWKIEYLELEVRGRNEK
jgi:hypothetical protein